MELNLKDRLKMFFGIIFNTLIYRHLNQTYSVRPYKH